MAKPKPDSPAAQADAVSIPARERDVAGRLTITKQGRAVLAALLMEDE